MEGGNEYTIAGAFLYVFTNNQGIWRTDLQAILEQLPDGIVSAGTIRYPVGQLRIYPNPFVDFTTIQLPQGVSGGVLRISDAMLQTVHTQYFQGDSVELYMNSLPPGVYFLSVQTGHGAVWSGKLVK